MACCRPEPDDPAEALEREYGFCEMFCKTFKRDFSALSILIKAKLKLKKYIRRHETIPTLFAKVARKDPHKVALILVDTGKTWTYQEVDSYSNAMANYLIKQGYKKGDVVAIYMENIPEFSIFWLGMAKAGIIGSLINFNLVGKSLLHCIQVSGAKGLLYSGCFASALSDIQSELPKDLKCYSYGPNDDSVFEATPIGQELKLSSKHTPKRPPGCEMSDTLFHIYTSGTTGLPKAAIITHTRFFQGCALIGNYVAMTPSGVVYDVLPLYHSAGGVLGLGMAYMFGATVVVRKKFSASQFWVDCIKYNCTYIQYIGEICRYLLTQPARPTDSQHQVKCMYGNGFRAQIWKEFVTRFKIPDVKELYGATEGNCNIINTTNRIGAIGFCTLIAPWAYPITLIRVDEETGEPLRDNNGLCIKCKPGQPGEMVGKIIRTDPTRHFDGYLNKDASTKKCAKDVFHKGDQVFLTGDIMVMDGLGYCYFRDRTGDTFRWRGENVSTQEVEATISSVVKLSDAVVYGVEVPGLEGKAGMAAIVDEGNIDIQTLYTEFQKALPAYARPVFIRLLQAAQAEMTSTFKLQKTTYRNDGFDPSKVKCDKLYYLDSKQGLYHPLDDKAFQDIHSQTIRL